MNLQRVLKKWLPFLPGESEAEKKAAFLHAVEQEVRNLKKNATPGELANLNWAQLNVQSKHSCVYGQLTGHCESMRTKELMEQSCIRVMDLPVEGTAAICGGNTTDLAYNLNGRYTGQTWQAKRGNSRTYRYLSALEAYICTNGANNAGIINWLKGNVEPFPEL